MKKRILSVLFIVALLVAALMVGAQAANVDPDGNGCPHCTGTVTWTEWNGTATAIADEGHYRLTNKTPVEYLNVNGIDIVIDVNGWNLYSSAHTESSRVLRVSNGGSATVIDSSAAQTGAISGTATMNGSAIFINSGTVNLYGGIVKINSAAYENASGGTVYINGSGELNMYGGEIRATTLTGGNGGAIYTAGATTQVNISGGTVTGGTVSGEGAAIYANGQLNISGTAKLPTNDDSNVALSDTASLTLEGTPVVNGLSVDPACSVKVNTLSEGANISLTTTDVTLAEANASLADYLAKGYIASYTGKVLSAAADNKTLSGAYYDCPCCETEPSQIVWTAWIPKDGSPQAGKHYYLAADATSTSQLTSTAGEYTLNLNNHTIKTTTRFQGFAATSVLNIVDSGVNGTISTSYGTGNGGIFNVNAGTLKLYDGTFVQTNASYSTHGAIAQCVTNGTIYVLGNAVLDASAVTGTNANQSALVCKNTAYIQGGTILANAAGNSVYVTDTATRLSVSGGNIQGDLVVGASKVLTLSGAPTVSEVRFYPADLTVNIEDLAPGASIGINASGAFTAAANDDAAAWVAAGYFTSKVTGKTVVAREGILYVEEPITMIHCPHCDTDIPSNQWVEWDVAWHGIADWTNVENRPVNGTHYYLAAGLYNKSQFVTPADADIILDMRDTYFRSTGRAFVVKDGATVSIVNTGTTNNAGISGYNSKGVLEVQEDSTLKLYSGVVSRTDGDDSALLMTVNKGTVLFGENISMDRFNGKIRNISGMLEGIEGALLMDQQSANGGIWYQTAQEAADLFVDADHDFIRLMGAATVKATQPGTFFNINGHDLTVDPASTVPVKVANMKSSVTAVDPATVTADEGDIQLVTPYTPKVQFIALSNGAGAYTVHRLELQLSYVTFRPASFGFYYKATFNTDDVLAAEIDAYGVALSLNGVPDYSVPTKTEMSDFAAVRGTDVKFGGLFGIMKSGNTPEQNAINGMQKVYANCYVKIGDMVILSDNSNVGKNANDAGFSGVGMSLFDVMQKLNGMTLEGEALTAVETFKTDLAGMGVQWPEAGDTELSIVPLA